MKVGYICSTYYPGHVPFYVQTQELAKLGVEVHAIALRRDDEPVEDLIDQVHVLRVLDYRIARPSDYIGFGRFLWSTAQNLPTIPCLDIMNVRNLPGVSVLRRYAQHRARKWVLQVQSPPLHRSWRSSFSNLRVRAEARAFDLTLVHRQAVGEAIFGRNGRFVEYPIGADFDHFVPGHNPALRKQLGVSPDETLLIYTGSIEPRRTLHRMLMGFHQAHRSIGKLHLLIVGEGRDLTRLRSLANSMGMSDRVHLPGYVPYARMPEYMQAADVGLCYVPMTPWFDKAPVLKTLESMASGLPTIATATEGNREYIRHGENGWLVNDSPESIASGICTLCQREDLRLALQHGRESIRAYDWKRIVRDIALPAYTALLK